MAIIKGSATIKRHAPIKTNPANIKPNTVIGIIANSLINVFNLSPHCI